jgi:probable HAF family extracellular repeat protein
MSRSNLATFALGGVAAIAVVSSFGARAPLGRVVLASPTSAAVGPERIEQERIEIVEPPLFRMYDLGDFGGDSANALCIDAMGRIYGEACSARDSRHAFLWETPGPLQKLPDHGATLSSSAWACNDLGHAVGYARDATWSFRATLWRDGQVLDLGTLGGPESFAFGINAMGTIVGASDVATSGSERAFVHEGWMRELPTLGGPYSVAYGVNDAGLIVGSSTVADGERACAWARVPGARDWIAIDLHVGGGMNSCARGVNAAGDIAGWGQYGSGNDGFGYYFACLWLRDPQGLEWTPIDLGNLPGMFLSRAMDVNDRREVVGATVGPITRPDRAFYWSQATGTLDLNARIVNAEGRWFSCANAINDYGDIAGYGVDQGRLRAFLLERLEDEQPGVVVGE